MGWDGNRRRRWNTVDGTRLFLVGWAGSDLQETNFFSPLLQPQAPHIQNFQDLLSSSAILSHKKNCV